MNYARKQKKTFRTFAAFVAALVMLVLAGAASPAPAQTYTVVGDVPANNDANPQGQITQGRNGDIYAASVANQGDFSVDTSGNFSLLTNSIGGGVGVVLGTDGNLYIARNYNNGCGDVYSVTPAGTSTLLAALCGNDGYYPDSDPIQASNGVLYGTASAGGTGNDGTIYSLTTSGTLTVLHTFTGTDGSTPRAPLVVGSDGNLYGGTQYGGTNNDGVLFKITLSGKYTVLHNFAGTDGAQVNSGLVLGSDGSLYGVTLEGGTGSQPGVFFKLTNSGTYKVLYSFQSPYSSPATSLLQGTNGIFYGILGKGNASQPGWIYSVTTSGKFAILHEFCQQTSCTDGSTPSTPLIQHTNGNLYGFTANGGTANQCSGGIGCGVFYSLNIGAKAFITLSSTSGNVGSTVGILGAGFTSSSVVKFNGVTATFTLNDVGYITATVPTGATDGYVTVTTGTTTLTSTKKYTVHNSWSSGAALPTGTWDSAVGVIKGLMYVVGGTNSANTILADNQIYNPATNKWSIGTSLPAATSAVSVAVVNNLLYVFGGTTDGTTPTNAVWAYNPTTKTWTGKAAMPTARWATAAVVEKNIIYVIGGVVNASGSGAIATVESYNPASNAWTEEAPMSVAKGQPAAGLLGTTIVVADGAVVGGGATGDNEGYNAATNKWTSLASDPASRFGSCFGSIGPQFYDVGGTSATTLNESFQLTTKKWTTLTPIPQSTIFPGSAAYNGLLYCFGGWASWQGSTNNNVQIYQP